MALEHSDEKKRGFSASFANMGAPAGAVLSTVVLAIVTLLPGDAFLSWGWRIPFLLSAVLVGIGLYVRLKVTESPLFEQEVITAVAVGEEDACRSSTCSATTPRPCCSASAPASARSPCRP